MCRCRCSVQASNSAARAWHTTISTFLAKEECATVGFEKSMWTVMIAPALCRLRVLTTISLCLLLLGGIFLSLIPFDLFVTIVLQRSVTQLPLSEVRNRGGNRRVAITGRRYVMTHAMRSSSQSRPVINFH